MRRAIAPLMILVCAAAEAAAQQPSPLDFLTGLTEYRQVRTMLGRHVNAHAVRLLEERRRAVGELRGAAEIEARKAYIRERFLATLGELPERTPLNARLVGTIERPDYRIEKIVFQSQPGFFVTANLYLPKQGKPPYPAVLYPLGHEPGGKAYPIWQQMLATLAKKGYVGLTWDPLGQGERVQLWDAAFGEQRLSGSTMEHTILGVQCLLVGDNLARYTIWDGIRALDYLVSRPEVDARRIAVSGNSGGGTHTAYLAALDDRIQVAAPSCYLTSWEKLLETIGPQDAEQCLPPWIGDGLDHADFVIAFAPKPYLMLAAIRDFFSIMGARRSYAEARHVYSRLGAEEKLAMAEADDGHGYSKPRRLAAYRWFARWLKGVEEEEPEPEVEIASREELNCTSTGQVVTSLGGETVYSLNRRRAEQAARSRPAFSVAGMRRLIGIEDSRIAPAAQPYGVIEREGYRIEKWVFQTEPDIAVPALLYLPAGGGRVPGIVLADGRGKSAADAEAAELVRAGAAVLSLDLRGMGETRSTEATKGSEWNRFLGDYDSAMTALLIGRPLLGMRVRDIVHAASWLEQRPEVDPARIYAIGRGLAAVPMLHAAALHAPLSRVGLDGMLVSYRAVVEAQVHQQVFENVVRGVLRHYDLPELAARLAPRPVWLIDAADPMGRPLAKSAVEAAWRAAPEVRIVRRTAAEPAARALIEMIR